MFSKIIIVVLFSFLLTFAGKSEEKIAFVDLNFIFTSSNAGKKMNSEILNKDKKLKSDFDNFQKKLDKEKEKIIAQKNVTAKEEYEKKILQLEIQAKEYQSVISKKNTELIEYRNKARIQFLKEIQNLLAEYSKDNSLSVILKKESILIGKTNLDITNDILELYNKKIKKIEIQ